MQRLQALQQKGIGEHLSYEEPTERKQAAQLQQDHFDLQEQLQETMQSPIMQQPAPTSPKVPPPKQDTQGTLAIARQASDVAASTNDESEARKDALDEIFIDLRGQLHHQGEDE